MPDLDNERVLPRPPDGSAVARPCGGARMLLAWVIALLGARAYAAATQAVPSTPSTPINVSAPSANAPSVGSLLVTVDGLELEETRNVGLLSAPKDIAEATAVAEVIFGVPVALAPTPGTQQRRWMLPFKVTGLPAGTTQTRYVAFKVGSTDWALPYQIVSPSSPIASWSLKPPPAASRQLRPTEGFPISIAVDGRTPISGVQLKPLDLVEQGTLESLTQVNWRLCLTKDKDLCDESKVKSLEGGPHSLWIVPTDVVPPGKYAGTVTIASLDKPAGESVSVTLNISSLRAKFLGFVAILAGVGFGLWIATFVRRRVERDQLLLGPSVLRMQAVQLAEVLHADDLARVPKIDKKLSQMQEALTESALESAGLPPKIPIPWPVNTEAYQKHVEAQLVVFNALRAIVDTGMLPLLAVRRDEEARDGPLDKGEETAFNEAMVKIDAIADLPVLPEPAAVPELAQLHISKFKDAIQDSRIKGVRSAANVAGVAPRRRIEQLRTPAELRLRVMQASVLAWALLGALTAIAGTYILILTNPGFGTPPDFFTCFLWGAGLPAGATLATANTSTVSTALSITR